MRVEVCHKSHEKVIGRRYLVITKTSAEPQGRWVIQSIPNFFIKYVSTPQCVPLRFYEVELKGSTKER